MAQKEFKVGNFAKLFNYNVFFGDYLHYINWAVKNWKTVDTLIIVLWVEWSLLNLKKFSLPFMSKKRLQHRDCGQHPQNGSEQQS